MKDGHQMRWQCDPQLYYRLGASYSLQRVLFFMSNRAEFVLLGCLKKCTPKQFNWVF